MFELSNVNTLADIDALLAAPAPATLDDRPALPDGVKYMHPAGQADSAMITETVVPDTYTAFDDSRRYMDYSGAVDRSMMYACTVLGFYSNYGWDVGPNITWTDTHDLRTYYNAEKMRLSIERNPHFVTAYHHYRFPADNPAVHHDRTLKWFNWFLSGEPGGGPWSGEWRFKKFFARLAEHMPQFSDKHPGLLAYYQTVDKRFRDIRTPIKPGKYLQKYFSDVFTAEEIHDLGMKWAAAAKPPKLTITQDADEIEQVYRGAYLGSCMHFGSGCFDGSEHPARVYAGPDLALAYIGDADAPQGRVLVWPERKQFINKMYGDTRRLTAALEADGWEEVDREEFMGTRIQRIEYEDAFVAPYLDFAEGVVDEGDYLRTADNYDIECRQTNGLSDRSERFECVITGYTSRDEDEFTYVPNAGGYVCVDELDINWFYCAGFSAYYHNDDRADVAGTSRTYSNEYVIGSDFMWCEGNERWYRDRDVITLADGTVWSDAYFEDNGFRCFVSNELYANEDGVTTADGRMVAKSLCTEISEGVWVVTDEMEEAA